MSELTSAAAIWVDKLKSPDAAIREKSIHALEMLGDINTLPVLAEVFATDTAPEIRALAQNAGKTIYYGALRRKMEAEAAASDEERERAAAVLAEARKRKAQERNRR